MDGATLRDVQAPLKLRYGSDPGAARITLSATGRLGDESITCSVDTGRALVEAGLHPATGGSPVNVCSGDMLLQALVACAGVTLMSVAASMDLPLRGGSVSAEGVLDVRGTLGVGSEAPVGFEEIRLAFDLDTDATPRELRTLLRLTERYCVVFQTLRRAPAMTVSHRAGDHG